MKYLIPFMVLSSTANAAVFLYPKHSGYIFQLKKDVVTVSENGNKLFLKPDAISTPKPWRRGMRITFFQKDKDDPEWVDSKEITWANDALSTSKPAL